MESPEQVNRAIQQVPVNHPVPPALRFWSAVIIFGIYLIVQFLIGIAVGIAGVVVAASRGLDFQDPEVLNSLTQAVMVPGTILGVAISGVVAIIISVLWFRKEVKDRSANGAAWVVGEPRALFVAMVIGMLLAASFLAVSPLLSQRPDAEMMGPVARMASKPGIQQLAWILLALLLAPPIEELLFRGVLFGGFCRSAGPFWAAFLTTGLFVLLHVTEMIHFRIAFVFVTLMALIALWLRLRTRAIGSAIAVHFGYNFVMVGFVLLSTSLKK